jgi:hypothetical protein
MTTTQPHSPAVATAARERGLFLTGLLTAVTAAVGTTLLAAIAMAVGVDFELPDGGESIPLSGFTTVSFVFAMVGVGIAAGLRRWSRRPSTMFVRVTVTLTAVSLVPPFLQDANAATVASLLLLHLAAAGIVIPVLARKLDA